MIIAISASESNSGAPVDAHFGRCPFFGIYDTTTKMLSFVENRGKDNTKEAGRLVVDQLLELGTTVVVAGRFGNKVIEMLRSKGVQMVVVAQGQTVDNIVNKIK